MGCDLWNDLASCPFDDDAAAYDVIFRICSFEMEDLAGQDVYK